MDLVSALRLAVIALGVMIGLYVVFLIISGWRTNKPSPPPPLAKAVPCTGTRNGKPCGKPVFRCANCGDSGCQLNGCDRRRFEPPGKCLSCGYPNTMQRV